MVDVKSKLSKYGITPDQFKKAVDELCKNGIGRGTFNTNALLAVIEVLGDAELDARRSEDNGLQN